MEQIDFLGDKKILSQHKTGFLCSRQIPASAVLKCYDWAIEQREKGNCIIGGFHSALEKDVFMCLLRGSQPVIMVLARGMKKQFEPILSEHINNGRLLVITPFPKEVIRVTGGTAFKRNQLILSIADEIVVGFSSHGGSLEQLLSQAKKELLYL